MSPSIPVYHADGSLYGHVSEHRLSRLQSEGLVARVVRHRKGHVNRAILFIRPGEPKPIPASGYLGTRYSFREHLDNGFRCWRFKKLDLRDENCEPFSTRSVFLQAVQDCLVR